MAKPIPDGFHAITPHLVIKGAADAIDFYKRAFGAVELSRMPFPSQDGTPKLGHAHLQIGDSALFLADEFPGMGGTAPGASSPVTLHLYVTDVDAVYKQAIKAGATAIAPPADMFWGDRFGKLVDPFGHHWSLATHKEDPTPEQMRERMAAAMSGQACGES